MNRLIRTISLLTLAALCNFSAPAATQRNLTANVLVIRGGRLLDGTGRPPLEHAVIVIRGERVAEIFVAGEYALPPAGRIIDAEGLTIMPGLIDGHVHLGGSAGGHVSAQEFGGGRLEHDLAAYLFCGVTTIRSLGDSPAMIFGLKRLQARGELAPAILAAGPVFTAPAGYPLNAAHLTASTLVRQVTTTADAQAQVRELAAAGADVIKVIYDGGSVKHPVPRLAPEVLTAIIIAAHHLHLPVAVHTGTCREVQEAAQAGADGVEHGVVREAIDAATIQVLREHHTFYCPTLTVLEAPLRIAGGLRPEQDDLLRQTVLPNIWDSIANPASQSSQLRADTERFSRRQAMFQFALDNLRRIHAAGVPITFGTDAGNEGVFPGATAHRELELLVAAGLSPAEAIMSATSVAARYARADKDVGTLAPGKRADLLIIGDDPLRSISATRAIRFVIARGAVVERIRLLEALRAN